MCHLQELYAKLKDKKLVVLGFNCSDDKQIALDMLRENGVTFPNIIDASDDAQKVCFQDYQRSGGSAVPMSYLIDPQGKVLNAWYGYEEGHARAIKALQKTGGELAEAVRRVVDARVEQSAKEVKAAAERLFAALRAADYDRDWSAADDWKRFPAKDAAYSPARDRRGWVDWACKKFKENPIADVRLSKVFPNSGGLPTVPFELRLKDGEILRGELPFQRDPDENRWIGAEGLDWHLKKN
jgi:hypothetical protein